jgi:hypothetical protein
LRFATVCLFCLWSVKRSINSLNLTRVLLNRIIKRVVFTSIFSMQIYEHWCSNFVIAQCYCYNFPIFHFPSSSWILRLHF